MRPVAAELETFATAAARKAVSEGFMRKMVRAGRLRPVHVPGTRCVRLKIVDVDSLFITQDTEKAEQATPLRRVK